MFGNCTAVSSKGVRCKQSANSKGLCRKHGGNGITPLHVQKIAEEEYVNLHPKLLENEEDN